MRSEKEMFDLILEFANKDDNLRVVVMNGSRANPNAPRDLFQDFDIACLVNDIKPYVRNPEIPKFFGEILILQEPEDMQDPPPENEGTYAYLMQFKDGNRIDLGFLPLDRLDEWIKDSQTIVLMDKDNILGNIPPASDRDYWVKQPTDKQFQDCCNEFWWVTPYVAKGLWRGELTHAKHVQDVYVRDQLLKMLTWYFGVKTNFKEAAGKDGKYIKQRIEPEIWNELEKTYSDSNYENIWDSLFTMGNLFRRMAHVVASEFGIQYPQEDDENVSEFIRRIKSLPKDAKEI